MDVTIERAVLAWLLAWVGILIGPPPNAKPPPRHWPIDRITEVVPVELLTRP